MLPKKVLQVCKKVPFPLKDGESIAVRAIAKSLHELGSQVTLLTLNTSKHFVEEKSAVEGMPYYEVIHFVPQDNKITLWGAFSNLLSSEPFHISRFCNAKFEKIYAQLLDNEGFDLVIFESITMAYVLEKSKPSATRIVLRSHNVEHQIWERIAENSGFLKKNYLLLQAKRLKKFELDIWEKVNEIWAISDIDCGNISKMVPRKAVKSLAIGLDAGEFEARELSSKQSASFIGNMEWMPNLEGVEWLEKEIYPAALKANIAIPIHVAGRNMPSSWLREKDTGLIYEGEIEDAKAFVLGHNITLVPLFSGSGIRTKILEAMAMGRIVLTTTIGVEGIPAVHRREVWIGNTVESWVDFITKLKEPTFQEDLKKMSANARKFVVENYDPKVILSKVLSF